MRKPQGGRPRQEVCIRGHPLIGPDADVYRKVVRGKVVHMTCRQCNRERNRKRRGETKVHVCEESQKLRDELAVRENLLEEKREENELLRQQLKNRKADIEMLERRIKEYRIGA